MSESKLAEAVRRYLDARSRYDSAYPDEKFEIADEIAELGASLRSALAAHDSAQAGGERVRMFVHRWADGTISGNSESVDGLSVDCIVTFTLPPRAEQIANAELIANARTDLPDLLAHTRKQSEVIRGLVGALQDSQWHAGSECSLCGAHRVRGHFKHCRTAQAIAAAGELEQA